MGAGREEGGEGVKERGAARGGGGGVGDREVKEVGEEGEEQGRKGGRERVCKSTEEWEGQNAVERERRGGGEGQRERT